MNTSTNFDKTDREYLLAVTDDLNKFRRSEVKGQGHSRPSRWRMHLHWCWNVKSIFYFCLAGCNCHCEC